MGRRQRALDGSLRGVAAAAYHVVLEGRSWKVGWPLFSACRGTAGPAIVFLHGVAGSGRYWYRTADCLEDSGVRLYLLDLLGFGRSPWPRLTYTADDHLAALDEWRHAAGLARTPLVLVGHSLGALLALAWAARAPGIAGAVLVGLPVYPSPDAARRRLARLSLLNRLTFTSRPLAWTACTLMCCTRPLCRLLAPLLLPALPAAVARDGVLHTWRSLSGTLDHCVFAATLDQVRRQAAPVPVLLVHGSADAIAPVDNVRALARSLPHARLQEMPDGSHDLPQSHPDQLAGLVRAFVAEVGAGAVGTAVGDRRKTGGMSPLHRNRNTS